MLFAAVIQVCIFAITSACLTKANIPSSWRRSHPRLRFYGTIPTLQAFTLCTWIKPYVIKTGCVAVISYANNKYDNALTTAISNYKNSLKVRQYINNGYKEFECRQVSDLTYRWIHICVTWSGMDGTTRIYANGRACTHRNQGSAVISRGGSLAGGGAFIIGQDQDKLDGGYDASQAFTGEVAGLQLWYRVLEYNLIEKDRKLEYDRVKGDVISSIEQYMSLYDGVTYSQSELCPIERIKTPVILEANSYQYSHSYY